MPVRLAFDAFGVSETGPVRPVNEDACLVDPVLGLFVVADGMGGHAAGEVAARVAVDSVHEFIRQSAVPDDLTWPLGIDPALSLAGNRVRTAIHLANRHVLAAAAADDARAGMGTTLVCALLNGGTLSFGHVGDSRLYLWTAGGLRALTRDDTWEASMVAAGGDPRQAAEHPMRNVLTNVIGSPKEIAIHVDEQQVVPGDAILLCSDGVHGPVGDPQLTRLMAMREDARTTASAIVGEAIRCGTRDNVTALVVRCLDGARQEVP